MYSEREVVHQYELSIDKSLVMIDKYPSTLGKCPVKPGMIAKDRPFFQGVTTALH